MIESYKRTRYIRGVRPSLWLAEAIDYFEWLFRQPEGKDIPRWSNSWITFVLKDGELCRKNDALLECFVFPALRSLGESLVSDTPAVWVPPVLDVGEKCWRGSGSLAGVTVCCRYDSKTSGIKTRIDVLRIA